MFSELSFITSAPVARHICCTNREWENKHRGLASELMELMATDGIPSRLSCLNNIETWKVSLTQGTSNLGPN